MRTYQYTSIPSQIQSALHLTSTPLPTPSPTQHLIRISATSLNPVDYKPAESPLFRRFMIPNPAVPGIDFAGTIVLPAKNSDLKVGERVFGCGVSPFAGGCLAGYAVIGVDSAVRIPEGVSMTEACTVGVAGLTAWQSIVPYIDKNGGRKPKVLINGGSGGTGVFGIQIAKAVGCEVVTTCSARNVELCRGLGADEVVDYTGQKDLAGAIERVVGERKVDHIVDNVMADVGLYWGAHRYSVVGAKYIVVAGGPNLSHIVNMMKMRLLPGWCGGGKRKVQGFFAKTEVDQLEQIGRWMVEGQVKAVVDEKFAFEDAPKAFERLKTGRARGKVVVVVQDL
ncbi:hypothetical protein OHC33_009162 [Knufia fluminis]|uniref:Enoyl reductase (ER) domain-containing protein n=1 Tax=Knufia fluminis TaxID=191047 RepID=A0AAN8EA77_9EURO|nr:hypothetical protein OHC33_009162 [Knufia fluminis]